MDGEALEKEYINEMEARITEFRRRATMHKWVYYITRSAASLLSISLPLLIQSNYDARVFSSVKITSLISVLVAAIYSFEGFLKPGELWRHNRLHQRRLEFVIRRFRFCGLHSSDPNKLCESLKESQAILRDEVEGYWTVRPLAAHSSGEGSTKGPDNSN